MWSRGWRERVWAQLERRWDLIVIGGGITGAGILRQASRAGLKALLVEARDFASGTSSRSSKLVHGGFRYLKNAQFKLTFESVRERDRLLREGRGLVDPLGFLMACYRGDPLPPWLFGIGLAIYDLLALKWGHRYYDPPGLVELCPPLALQDLLGGYRYFDARVDDARLVLRVIREAVRQGGVALNYARVEALCRTQAGAVCGVVLRDEAPGSQGRTAEVTAAVVINAAGAWADDLRALAKPASAPELRPRLRRLRGSHLVYPYWRVPLARAVSIQHPHDRRPVFAIPWEGVIVIGTTDVDHGNSLQEEPAISEEEAAYLLAWLQRAFPSLELSLEEAQATFSGVRAVVDTGKVNPSRESREHVLWAENGLVTVTGGKLTTFRRMAHDALRSVRRALPDRPRFEAGERVLDLPLEEAIRLPPVEASTRLGLLGRYGEDLAGLVEAALPSDWETIGESRALWAELRWAARAEGVVHLEDLLLRRVRLGLLLPQGGLPWLERIRSVVQGELGWDDARWQKEADDYAQIWRRCYAPAPRAAPSDRS